MKLAVIGGGIAGTAAAWMAARSGAEVVLFQTGAGASSLYSGALDRAPWDERAFAEAISPPVLEFARALRIWDIPAGRVRVATAQGLLRPARGRDRALLDLEALAGKQIAVADVERDDWDGRLLAAGYAASEWAKRVGTSFRTVRVAALARGFERRIAPYDFAEVHDAPQRIEALLRALTETKERPDAWLFGPWLGLREPVSERLSDALGVPVGETTSLPGGVAGARLELARARLLGEAGVVVESARAERVERRERGFRIRIEGRPEAFDVDAVVIAVGGVAAGGLELGRRAGADRLAEYQLSLEAPVVLELDGGAAEVPCSLGGADLGASGMAALTRVGIAVGAAFAARGAAGIFAAGDVVAGQPRTALQAAESGICAARAALALFAS